MNMKLRQGAEERLKSGTAPITRGWPTGVQALTLLHGLSSSPDSASDALKYLHELQVHQVELDLQAEQADLDRQQLAEDLTNYTALFDLAPFAYLTLDPDGRVIAANCIAVDTLAEALGQGKEVAGRRIEDLLAPESRAAIQDMLTAVREGEGRQSCAVQFKRGGASTTAVATKTPGGGQVLVALVPAGPGPAAAG